MKNKSKILNDIRGQVVVHLKDLSNGTFCLPFLHGCRGEGSKILKDIRA